MVYDYLFHLRVAQDLLKINIIEYITKKVIFTLKDKNLYPFGDCICKECHTDMGKRNVITRRG